MAPRRRIIPRHTSPTKVKTKPERGLFWRNVFAGVVGELLLAGAKVAVKVVVVWLSLLEVEPWVEAGSKGELGFDVELEEDLADEVGVGVLGFVL
jgi:hypothetical protein